MTLMIGGEHSWSLCVEMQFYLTVATSSASILGRRGLYLVPVLALAVTAARVISGEQISIVTWHKGRRDSGWRDDRARLHRVLR